MQNRTIKKSLVCLVIILFIGIAVAPSVTSIDISNNTTSGNDLVEITMQLCKSSGVEDHKMYISQEQNEQLEFLIEDFKADLDNADTRDETIEIYKDMVVSLNELGILPEDLSCEEVQQLVTGENSISNPEMKSNKHFNQAYEKFKNNNFGLDENENKICLIAGKTTNTLTIGLGTISSFILCFSFLLGQEYVREYFNESALWIFLILLFNIPARIFLFTSILSLFSPLILGGLMTFGRFHLNFPPEGDDFYPAEGWVHTIGLNGIKKWDGSFYGDIDVIGIPMNGWYIGATGFTGLKIPGLDFYLGTALQVKLR